MAVGSRTARLVRRVDADDACLATGTLLIVGGVALVWSVAWAVLVLGLFLFGAGLVLAFTPTTRT